MSTPLVTIGIPIYNTAKYVLDSLDSIKNQTYKNIEIIVVDDGSTDDSRQRVQEWAQLNGVPIQLIINEKNMGLTHSCNLMLNASRGKYFQKLDADDVILETKIERHVQMLESFDDNTAAVYSYVKLIDEEGDLVDQDYNERIGHTGTTSGDFFCDLLKLNFIPNPSVLIRTAAIQYVGGYDSNLLFEDYDLWLKLAKHFKFFYDSNVTCLYRVHKESMMGNPEKLILRNNTNIDMYKKNIGFNKKYDNEIMKRLKLLTIYSYYKNDSESKNKLRWYLKQKFDFKVLIYYLLASLSIKHLPSRFKGLV